jgi:hypothetical protein
VGLLLKREFGHKDNRKLTASFHQRPHPVSNRGLCLTWWLYVVLLPTLYFALSILLRQSSGTGKGHSLDFWLRDCHE